MLSFAFGSRGTIKFLLSFYLLITSLTGYVQGDNSFTRNSVKIHFDDFTYTINSQDGNSIGSNNIRRVDSIANGTGISRHFGGIYNEVMENIAIQMQNRNSAEKLFVKKFESRFADYFLNACMADKNGNLSPAFEWKCYFSSSYAQHWQMVLLGVNAHTNIDMWQALVDNFSEIELRLNKKQLLAFQLSIAKVYYPFFDTIMIQNGYLRFINGFTKGLTKHLGERLIYKWRRRQVNIAILFYHDHEKFEKRLAIINKKKQRIDRLILRHAKQPMQPPSLASVYDQVKRRCYSFILLSPSFLSVL
jgi:Family of unknown function (DUF5995)